MLKEKALNRLESSFDKFDNNGDGYIDQSDFERIVDETCRAVGRDPRSPEATNVRYQYVRLCNKFIEKMDTSSDRRVSREEFLAGARALDGDQSIVALNTAAAVAMFNLIDVDGDGEISLDEYAKSASVAGATRQQIQDDFRAFDKDSSGSLSLHELLDHLKSTYGV